MKYLFLLIFCLIFSTSNGQDKTICITVDDLPTVTYGIDDPEFSKQLTQDLINTFDQFDIPAIGYVNEGKLYDNGTLNSSKVDLLKMWLSSGYELGNHTYSHPNYHEVSFIEFSQDVLKGEEITSELTKKYGSENKFFRHPYLKIGLRQSHADSLRNFLSKHGYTEAPVTIDNEDYIFALAYHRAYSKGNSLLMEKIGTTYVNYMEQKLHYFEEQSKKLFNRNIAHILLTHANLLNAHYMDDLAEMYQKNGYRFVSQTDVLKDDAYNQPVTLYGNWGISWIDRWALSQGKSGEFFKGDPVTPEFIRELAK